MTKLFVGHVFIYSLYFELMFFYMVTTTLTNNVLDIQANDSVSNWF